MCANPAVPTDNHAAADNRARTDPTARSYLCSGLNHGQRPDLRRRIDARPLCDNCGRVNTGRNWWHGIEQCSNARPSRVWFGRSDRHRSQLALALPYQDARSQHRPMSDPVPKRNAGCPENSLHSGQPFAEGPHLRGAVRVHPQSRVPYSQQPQVDMAHFGERTLRCPRLLQPSAFPLALGTVRRALRARRPHKKLCKFRFSFRKRLRGTGCSAGASEQSISCVRNHYARCAWRAVK